MSKRVAICRALRGGNSAWRSGTRNGTTCPDPRRTARTGRTRGRFRSAPRRHRSRGSSPRGPGWGGSSSGDRPTVEVEVRDVEGGAAAAGVVPREQEAETFDGRVDREPDRVRRVTGVLRADTGAVGAPPQTVEWAADGLAHHRAAPGEVRPEMGAVGGHHCGHPGPGPEGHDLLAEEGPFERGAPGAISSAATTLNQPYRERRTGVGLVLRRAGRRPLPRDSWGEPSGECTKWQVGAGEDARRVRRPRLGWLSAGIPVTVMPSEAKYSGVQEPCARRREDHVLEVMHGSPSIGVT